MSAFHSRIHGRDGPWRRRSSGAARTLCAVIAAMARRYDRERRIAAEANYLKSFDDRMLSDIGLTRAEIDDFVRHRATQGMPQSKDDGAASGRPCGPFRPTGHPRAEPSGQAFGLPDGKLREDPRTLGTKKGAGASA